MNERTIFMEALGKETEAHRSTYLDATCGNDLALRERVETLLKAHGDAGGFLEKSVPERLSERNGDGEAGTTQGEATASPGDEKLMFLTPSDRPDSLGRLGHYEILEVIGRGGMGVVLRALDEQLHRVVAIKVMAAQLATNATARKRFAREAQAQAAVSHDHIVTIHAVEADSTLPYLVMQYVAGMSLQERLDKTGALELDEILRIGMQTAAGLAAAHSQGLVHRDIKPANILLENGVERVKVTDFGLARAASEASLTQSGVVAGTPQYMSPEQAEGNVIDQRTDLFSLGSVLYAMCTGRTPFRASGSMAVLKRVCEETPRPIRETNPDIPDWLVAIIDKLHAKDPTDRYQTAAEVAELLNQHLAHLQHPSVVPLPVTRLARPPTARRRRMMAALALLSLIAVAIVLAATLPRLFTPEVTPIVKDSPEGKGPSSGTAAKADPHPFIVLSGKGVAERKFGSLAEAVLAAGDGDTIEIRGNGPFVIEPVEIHTRILAIRAGQGARPVIRLSPQASQAFEPMLVARGEALVLEGLEFQRLGQREYVPGEKAPVVISTRTAALHIANCRFRLGGSRYSRCVDCFATVRLRNCEFIGFAYGVEGGARRQESHVVENCVHVGGMALTVSPGAEVRLTRNTLVSPHHLLMLPVQLPPEELEKTWGAGPARLEASANVLDGRTLLLFLQYPASLAGGAAPEPADAEAMLRRMLAWRDRGNLYREGSTAVNWWVESLGANAVFPLAGKAPADWKRFWNDPQAELSEGRIRYQGGDLLSKLAVAPEKLTPEDFRLRPDSAGYRAGKDGKDLGADVDLVGPGPSYESWKKTPEYQQWLKDTKQFRAETPKSEPKAFVLLGGMGVEFGKYDTLAEAVLGASDGDTIEIRGNGPFVTQPVSFGKRSLTIRAATGYRPVIKGNAGRIEDGVTYLLHSQGPLVLEGLELHMTGLFNSRIVFSVLGPLHVANCRFVLSGFHSISAADTLVCTVRNCEFVGTSGGARNHVISALRNNGKLTLENNLLSSPGGQALSIFLGRPDLRDLTFHLKHNTVATPSAPIIHGLMFVPESAEPGATPGRQPVQVNVSENLFELIGVQERIFSLVLAPDWYRKDAKPLSATEAERLLPRLLAWREERNLYCKDLTFLAMRRMKDQIGPERAFVDEPLPAGRTFADWQRLWNTGDSGSVQGVIRYEGGDVVAKMKATPELITAADFRLRPDSAGYKAGKDGKDLGADVDLVGPGPAYERWKKTPEYQQWLKETKQVTTAEAPKTESKAFVLLRGTAIAVRKFNTLADAVQGASDGDTIEVRGNGPFVSEPIDIKNQSLIIRAADGFRPVLKLTAEAVEKGLPLLETSAPLVLEGLELQRQTGFSFSQGGESWRAIIYTKAPLYAANCRFLLKGRHHGFVAHSPIVELRNCEFLCDDSGAFLGDWSVGQRWGIENCVQTGDCGFNYGTADLNKVSIRLVQNTVVRSSGFVLSLFREPSSLDTGRPEPPVRVEASGNVFDTRVSLMNLEQAQPKPLPAAEAEAALRRLLAWQGRGNLYGAEKTFLRLTVQWNSLEPATPIKSLADWKQFWGGAEVDSLEGRVRYQGGNLLSKLRATPEKLTPEDFRLRPDSAGYRAGKDGKDLGADIDFVGPGPAYERWQKTPEYQQWLKDSGQVKK